MRKSYVLFILLLVLAHMGFAADGRSNAYNYNDPAVIDQLSQYLQSAQLPGIDSPEKIAAYLALVQQAQATADAPMIEKSATAQDQPANPRFTLPSLFGKITGTVTMQTGGTPIADTWVNLYTTGNVLINTAKTNSSGVYTLNLVPNGTYKVKASGWTGSIVATKAEYFEEFYNEKTDFASANTVTVSSGGTVANVNFTLVKGGKISGRVARQSDNSDVNGAMVTLYDANWNVKNVYLTISNGAYEFGVLAAGNYYVMAVRMDLGREYWNEAPFSFEATALTIAEGTEHTNINFTLQRDAEIGGLVWNDEDGNGALNGGEAGLNGIKVSLQYKGHNVPLSPMNTLLGIYGFVDLPIVEYTLSVDYSSLPYGYIVTHGTNPYTFTPAEGEINPGLNYGLHYCWGSLAGHLYNDLNKNGQQDDGEPGIADATVLLDGALEGHDNQSNTITNGQFSFKKVQPGDYTLFIYPPSLPANFVNTGVEKYTVHVAPCGELVKNFFYADTVTARPCNDLAFIDGSPTYSGEGWDNAIDADTTDWDGTVTTRGEEPDYAAPAWAIFQYTCDKMTLFNQINIKTDNGVDQIQQYNRQAREIQIWASQTGIADADFGLVTTIYPASRWWQTFAMPSEVRAKYIKLVIVQPTKANGAWRQLVEFQTDYQAVDAVSTPAKQIEQVVAAPTSFELGQNYPNPFNPQTAISYNLAKETKVLLRVFDTNGREMATLVNGQQSAGRHVATWNAQGLPSGTYFYQLTTEGFQDTKRMLLLK